MFVYWCPDCDSELTGGFGDDVHCEKCDKTFETGYDLNADPEDYGYTIILS